MKKWERIEPTKSTKVGFRTVISKTFKMPDGTVQVWDTNYANGVNVIALNQDNEVVVVRQFRPGPELIMDELPGGYLEDGETPERAVRRELLDETGYEAGKMEYLGIAHYDAYTSGERHNFIAYNCKKSNQKSRPDHNEFIEVRLITVAQLLKNAKAGLLTDPGAVLFAYEKLQKIANT